ncbi:MAG: pyruvate formate lyase family protein [Desulfobacterales bacterium]
MRADLLPFVDPMTFKKEKIRQDGPDNGDAATFQKLEAFWAAYEQQTRYIIQKCKDLYEQSELCGPVSAHPVFVLLWSTDARKRPGRDPGAAEISFVTLEAVTFATTVDSLLAIKYLTRQKKCTMEELIQALKNNWEGHGCFRLWPKTGPWHGRDDAAADAMAKTGNGSLDRRNLETLHHLHGPAVPAGHAELELLGRRRLCHGRQRGRPEKGQFLSNAICPSNGADIHRPTANSVGTALGGKDPENGDWEDYVNSLPNGASHTITFNPAIIRDPEHRDKFKAFLKDMPPTAAPACR